MHARLFWSFVAALGVGVFAPRAQADMPVPNQHNQTTHVRLDQGPYADYATRFHTIAKGDTLHGIAKTVLGDAARWKEIATRNPDAKPTELHVGKTLELPPRKTPQPVAKAETKDGPRHEWGFYAFIRLNAHLTAIPHNEVVPTGPYTSQIVAIRADKLADFRKQAALQGGMRKYVQALGANEAAWFARSTLAPGRRGVSDDDPIHRIDTLAQVTAIRDGVIHSKNTSKFFDRGGKELSAAEVKAARGSMNWILLLLTLGGIAGLIVVARRRMPAQASLPA